MDARAIIGKLRRGASPDADELAWFAKGLSSGAVTDAQAGAFAMAVCLNGLGEAGRVALTAGMRDSGDVLNWDMPGPVLDKHSTGGVGDCVSLILAPALAACGVFVPMISGRGFGRRLTRPACARSWARWAALLLARLGGSLRRTSGFMRFVM